MNNIDNISSGYKRQAYAAEPMEKRTDNPAGPSTEQPREPGQDVVSLSSGSRDLQVAKQAVRSAGEGEELRAQRVEELKLAVSEGRYTVNAEQVAEKRVGSIISAIV